MARSSVPFEIGAKVRKQEWVNGGLFARNTLRACGPVRTVAGYTYWGIGMSILTIDDDGNEEEFMHGQGLVYA